MGRLNRLRLFVLMRLIAHAQAADMQTVSADCQFLEPPSLPVFDLAVLNGGRVLNELGGSAHAAGGESSTPPEQQADDVLNNLEQQMHTMMLKQPGAFYCEPMTAKDRKKYLGIFAKTDTNGDGYAVTK